MNESTICRSAECVGMNTDVADAGHKIDAELEEADDFPLASR